jgi:hypothetical protein
MFDSIPVAGSFLAGAVGGLGHGLSLLLMRLMVNLLGSRGDKADPYSAEMRKPQEVQNPDKQHLEEIVSGMQTEAEWKNLITGLKQSGMPFDASAAEQLTQLGDEVLKKATSPPEAVDRLAKLTAGAFERAGIELPELARWQDLSARLVDDDLLPERQETSPPTPGHVSVAMARRPSTWWVWSRADADRRLLRFIQSGVEHSWRACDQALASAPDLSSLRTWRQLREELVVVRELLQTMPPLVPDKRELRVEAWRIKQLLSSLEQAVRATETLSTEMNRLLACPMGTQDSQASLAECRKAMSILVQTLHDRRAVR